MTRIAKCKITTSFFSKIKVCFSKQTGACNRKLAHAIEGQPLLDALLISIAARRKIRF